MKKGAGMERKVHQKRRQNSSTYFEKRSESDSNQKTKKEQEQISFH